MYMKKSIRLYGIAALLALLAMVSIGGTVNAARPSSIASPPPPQKARPATHDRLGQLNWNTVGTNVAHFVATAGIRRSFYNPPPNVGDSVNFTFLAFGDGFQSSNQLFIVTFVDPVNDWIIARKEETHTYSSSGPFTASFGTCCRLSAPLHINNPD